MPAPVIGTRFLVTFRCRWCTGLFARGITMPVPTDAHGALQGLMREPNGQTATHTCHPSTPYIIGAADLIGVRVLKDRENIPAEPFTLLQEP